MGQIVNNNHIQTRDEPRDEDESASQPAADPNQRVEHLIEQLKLRTDELEEANRELRRVSHYRSLFLARMSHELRTPLTSILGFSEILLDQEQLTEAQRRFCQKIRNSGLQLQTSLNQLVDLSRIEGGQTELFLQEFLLKETLRESCAALARPAQMRQVQLEYDLAPDVSTVVSDPGKLRQILYNFLGWSLSRSSSGQLVSIYADLIDATLLRICIDDSGEPIADLSRVFDPEASAGGREANVNELGIIIGHRLLDVMNGNVTLQNRDGGGLRVLIQLPARPAKG
jgi:two-component system sensor histidine kinase BarA